MTAINLTLRPETFVSGQVFTRSELATYLRLHPRTLANWSALGTGPAQGGIGRDLFYAVEDVASWLSQFRTGTKARTRNHLRAVDSSTPLLPARLYTRTEAAQAINRSAQTLANWASTGKLHATYAMPLAPRYTRESLSPWMMAGLEVAA